MQPDPDTARAALDASTIEHAAAARHHADVLVARTRRLVCNGVDLRNPERLRDFASDQVVEAITGATVGECGCPAASGAASMFLIMELARRLAEVGR